MADRSDAAEPTAGSVRYVDPEGLHKNPAFTNVVVVEGPAKTVYVGGQDSVDASGNIVGKDDIVAQTEQILANLRAALEAGGARPEHIIKWNIYIVEGQSLQVCFAAHEQAVRRRLEPVEARWPLGVVRRQDAHLVVRGRTRHGIEVELGQADPPSRP